VRGTMGTLAAMKFWYLMTFLKWQQNTMVEMKRNSNGGYLRQRTAKDMGNNDKGRSVWDE
ncbi:phosphatidylglycerophosphatase A, partial [Stenotrophomonas maltophilia]|uniref:hypothetical protein n=1 Tax=Stenotrophomonas maltophilia TaxID=40324 RepID=UPI0031C2572E|nr:phosphatidylglycerophosphatase A [Stenotrophomonas maltophilia]